jgi:DNA-binding IclR family transcriptional regulator
VLQALQERGFIYEVSPRGGYYPTLRMYETGRMIAENDPVVLRAELCLRDMRDRLDETVLLAKSSGLRATYLLAFESTHQLRYQQKVGDFVSSLYAASGGKALLGSLDPAALDAAIESIKMKPLTPKTITSKAALREQVVAGRNRGYYVNDGESIEGVITLSAPFIWYQSLYLVTIAGPAWRLENRVDMVGEQILEVCRKLEMKTVR